MRTVIAASVDVDVDAARAWSALTDWAAQGSWMPLTRVDVVTDAAGCGTRLRAVTGVGPAAVVDEMEIDRWEPPHRCDVRHDGRLIRGRGVFLVEPLGRDRARVTWEEHLDGLPARATAPVGRRILNVALRRFADAVSTYR
ncbi:MAG TPA: SRPBCC family protein [Mycobacteriales bacterium]|nr:SRPBCC family protein [Mycobacteriales bacterium]